MPSACATAGTRPAFSFRNGHTRSMNGLSSPGAARENQSAASSSGSTGANGRNASRNLTVAFRRAFARGERGSQRMLRPPSARGPSSEPPWNQPTILPARRTSTTSPTTSRERRARTAGTRATAASISRSE